MIHIRLARKEDIRNIMPLYAYARKFMAANGNPHQWYGNYPASEDILKDIELMDGAEFQELEPVANK